MDFRQKKKKKKASCHLHRDWWLNANAVSDELVWKLTPINTINLRTDICLWIVYCFTKEVQWRQYLTFKGRLCETVDFWVSLAARQILMLRDCGSVQLPSQSICIWWDGNEINFLTKWTFELWQKKTFKLLYLPFRQKKKKLFLKKLLGMAKVMSFVWFFEGY